MRRNKGLIWAKNFAIYMEKYEFVYDESLNPTVGLLFKGGWSDIAPIHHIINVWI